MDLSNRMLHLRSFLLAILFRLVTGRYSRRAGIGIGIVGAAILAVIGFLLGPSAAELLEALSFGASLLMFRTSDLSVLWGVHATVVTFTLVGLSFAWNSVQNLPTTDTIISEIAYRLRSIETITFLLSSNLLIGLGILIENDEFVSSEIGFPVGLLLVASVGVTVQRFWYVFDLLLHNTLDKKVFEFAEAALTGRSMATSSDYDTYLGHFFDAARIEIEHDRPERLREKLRGVEQLLESIFAAESTLINDREFWDNVFSNYDSIYRRSIVQQNSELEKQVIASVSGIFWKTQSHGHPDLMTRTIGFFSTLFIRGYSTEPQSSSTDFLLQRFQNSQRQILSQFENADDEESLKIATTLIENLLETHSSLLRIAVENESIGAMDYLRHMLDDVYQFRRYSYASPRDIREAEAIDVDPVSIRKQEKADDFRRAISRLRFAAYGWALHLFQEGDTADYFAEQVFSKYVESDFGSVTQLSEMYFDIGTTGEILNYWERWNLDRELEQGYGAATTGMAANTWLLRFYCTALVWVVGTEEEINSLESRDVSDSPILDYEHIQHRIDDIVDILDSYRDSYPLQNLLSGGPSTDERCEALIDHFEEVKALFDEQEQDWIRELPISEEAVDGLSESVDSQLDSCGLRTALNEVSEITQVESIDEGESIGFTMYGTAPRQAFVDDGIETFFNSTFARLIDRYRQLVLDNLDLDERVIDSAAGLPDLLADMVMEEDVAVIVIETMDAERVLRDDDRSERAGTDVLGSYFAFAGVPIVTDVTTNFSAVAIFEKDFQYVEESGDYPISIRVVPGENVDEWDEDDLSDDQDIRDQVRIVYSYKAKIQTENPNGVIFRVSN